MADIGGDDSVELLIGVLRNDPAPEVRRTVAKYLGLARLQRAVEPLNLILGQSSEELTVRETAAEALVNIGNPKAIPTLLSTLINMANPISLRILAAESLGSMGDAAIDALIEALNTKDLQTQYLAIATLSELQTSQSLKALSGRKEQVTKILDAADQADLIEKERVPVQCLRGRVVERPIICRIEWIQRNWPRCTQRHRATPQQCNR